MKQFLFPVFLFLSSCQTSPSGSVVLGNDHPQGNCVTLGQAIGNSNSRENSKEKALNDLRHEASLKSGNYVRVLAISAHGSSARGMVYRCR